MLLVSVSNLASRAVIAVSANALGMQLLIDIRREADLTDAVDVARARAEADAVQYMEDGLVVGIRGNG